MTAITDPYATTDRSAEAFGGVARPVARPPLPVTLADVLLRSYAASPDAEALILPTERYTYADLYERSWAMARSLAGLGVRPRDHVGVLMTNCVDFVVVMFASAMLGATLVPINARYRSHELKFLIADADLRVIVTNDRTRDYVDYADLLEEALPGLRTAPDPLALSLPEAPLLTAIVMLGTTRRPGLVDRERFEALAGAVDPVRIRHWCEAVPVRSVAAIIYTSGTTSQPRGAMLSQEGLVRHWVMTGRRWGVRPTDRFWNPAPMFHIAGIGPLVFTLAHGAALVTDTYFEPGRALDQIDREKPTLLYPTYPPLMTDLITHPKFASTDFGATRVFLNVAPPETLRKFQAAIPHASQISLYGSTEGGCVSMHWPEEDHETRMTTGGMPMTGVEVAVVDPETGRPAAPGVLGEIRYRGYNALLGYWKDPEKTAAAIDADGWVHTGDVGDFDDKGRLTFRGRVKDMLKVGGENVAPAEVEQYLESHPAVKLAQVVGIPDERLVEVVAAFVELNEGASTDEAELIAYCRGRVAGFKVPRIVRIVTSWPMSTTKIQRNKLRDGLIAELAAQRAS